MAGHRLGRVNEDIKRELSAIMRELKDPRLHDGLISIVRVEVTNDLSYCTVFISNIEGIDKANTAVKALDRASGFIRHELSSRLDIRQTPKILFKATNSIEYSAKISKIITDLKGNKDE